MSRKLIAIVIAVVVALVTAIAVGVTARSGKNLKGSACGALTNCHLLNLKTGRQISLFDHRHGDAAVEDFDSHTIICEVDGHVDSLSYAYSNQTHQDSNAPFALAGHVGGVVNEARYLSELGKKEIVVSGNIGQESCFEETLQFEIAANYDEDEGQNDRRVLPEISVEIGPVKITVKW